ncbi:hypothetical protein [Erythrobacter sp. JK5]|uniref:hypothetical protein n=1 Tax=Erythrobacter sp. JK5 TaxID=2829500 RepID=UPI00201306E6|nr:hypothetical protein [Erythrobacter sp. JK5]
MLAALASFIAGGMLVGYIVWYNAQPDTPEIEAAGASLAETSPSATTPAAALSPTPAIAEAIEAIEADNPEGAVEAVTRVVAEQQGGIDQRLAAAEQRLARLDLQAQAAAGNAARAEGLLIAFATRRAIERGAELGYLADQLRLRFSDQWPNAVSTIINFSRRETPIRLDTLIARLEGLGPQLSEREESMSFQRFRRELGQLFVVRRESTPSPKPERRLERARFALEQGRFRNAIDEVRNMPGAEKAEAWIADAEEYMRVMEALERIETAAVLDQSGLRDGAGNPVRQPSPLDSANEE